MLDNITITDMEVSQILSGLDVNSAAGLDGIPAMYLRNCATDLGPILARIFRSTLDTDQVPEMWKKATVTPIFKKGDKTMASSYRPISLTSVPGKVMERIIASRIKDHVLKNHLIPDQQHGFVPARSTLTNLLA